MLFVIRRTWFPKYEHDGPWSGLPLDPAVILPHTTSRTRFICLWRRDCVPFELIDSHSQQHQGSDSTGFGPVMSAPLSRNLSSISLIPPPPGVVSNFENPVSHGDFRPIYLFFSILGGLSVVTRLYTRIFLTRSVGSDDCKTPFESRNRSLL